MIPKFRAYAKRLDRMMEVTVVNFEEQEVQLLVARDGSLTSAICVPFDDIELMQSTGLFDKNGVEIFEGDVVTIDTDEFDKLIVRYREGAYWMCDGEFETEVLSEYYKFLEVIGNIYENPELMSNA